MARTRTLLQLRTSVQQRGAYENSADITSAILTEAINEAISETYDILVQRWADYYVTRANLTVTANADTVALPSDFYKLRKLEVVDSTAPSGYRKLSTLDLSASHAVGSQVVGKRYRYRLEQGNVVLMPTPTTGETLRIFYVPEFTLLSADGDTFDGINGYEELVIQLALLRCKRREELPTDDIEREINRLTLRVRDAADGRDASAPLMYNPFGPVDVDYDEEW